MIMPSAGDVIVTLASLLGASLVAKVTVVIGLGFLSIWLARRARAAVRHALLTATFGAALALPVVSIVASPVPIAIAVPMKSRPPLPTIIDTASTVASVAQTDGASSAVPRRQTLSLSVVLLMGWALGTGLCLLPVMTGLWAIRSLRQSAFPWQHGQLLAASVARDARIYRRADVFLHPDLPGPMTCGVAHPAILLPRHAEEWNQDDLRRAVVHELEHVRRGDSITRCLARIACALYWFHPLVWIAWRRLVLEAERACDDAVLACSEPTAYAGQLVELATRLAAAHRTPFLAMANRSDLRTRVHALLDVRQRRGRVARSALAFTCALAAALIAGIAPLALVAAPQQPESAFEVASVKPSPPIRPGDRVYFGPARGGPGTNDPRRITWTYAALRNVLMAAYNLQTFQIVAPDWLATERYDIAANVPDGTTREQVPVLWQQLLKERFSLVLHHESREFQVEEVTVAKGGAKLKETDLGANPDPFLPDLGPPKPNPAMNGYGATVTITPDGQAQMVAKALTMADIAVRLGNALRMPVLDKTGLTGRYDFRLDYTIDLSAIALPPGGIADTRPEPGPDLASAVEKQLGLKLSRAKASLDVIIVDHVERVPSEN